MQKETVSLMRIKILLGAVLLAILYSVVAGRAQNKCNVFLSNVKRQIEMLEKDRLNFISAGQRFYNRTQEHAILDIVNYLECKGE